MRVSGSAHWYARRVAGLLEEEGFLDVELERRVAKAQWPVKGRPYISFDVSYLLIAPPHREYVECKYKEDGNVKGEDVAMFAKSLESCGIPRERGIVVTNNGYELQALDFARLDGIRLYVVPAEAGSALSLFRLYRRPAAVLSHIGRQLTQTPSMPKGFEPY